MEDRTFLCDLHLMELGFCPNGSLPQSHIFQGRSTMPVEDEPVGSNFFLGSSSSSSLGSNHPSMMSSFPERSGYMAVIPCEPAWPAVGGSHPYSQSYCQAPLSSNAYGVHLSDYQNNHITNHGREPFKRKNSGSLVHETGNSMRYDSRGSSSELPIHVSAQPWQDSTAGFQYCPWDVAHRGRALSVSGQRNVRRRSAGSLHLDPNADNSSASSLHQYYFTGHSLEQLGGRDFGDVTRTTAVQGLSQAADPYRRISIPDNFGPNWEVPALPAISNNGSRGAEINDPNYVYSRNSVVPWQNSHAVSLESRRSGHRGFPQGSVFGQRPASSYQFQQHSGSGGNAMLDGPQFRMEPYMSTSRLPRQFSSIGERSNERQHRSIGRISFVRSEQISDETNARGRWFSEGAEMLDHSSYYGSENFIDRHRDMRLDIDNMSYEELLALGEHIGDVSTGLSQEFISKHLKQKTYVTSRKAKEKLEEDETCIVCQEDYNNRDDLGTLDCGHDYHFHCIRQWLLLKNVCPICKATALGNRPDR